MPVLYKFADGSLPHNPPGHSDKSACEQLRDDINTKRLLGAYIPRCTEQGEFERMQCGTDGSCWCVTKDGTEIPTSLRQTPERPDCTQYCRCLMLSFCHRLSCNNLTFKAKGLGPGSVTAIIWRV